MAETSSRQTPDIGASKPVETEGDFCPLPGSESSESKMAGIHEAAAVIGEGARQLTRQGQQAGSELLDKLGSRLQSQLHNQKNVIADRLETLAQALRQASGKLREEKNDAIASYASKSADRIEQFSRTLHEQDLRQMAERAENFARRQPALVLGGAFACGLLLARFFRHSSGREH